MIIDNKVYDVTKFLEEHPGGEDILLDSSGRDATREFEDVGHSAEARAQLDDLRIGDVRPATEEELKQAAEEAAKRGGGALAAAAAAEGGMLKNALRWLLPLVLVGVAYLLRKYTGNVPV